MDRKGEDGGGNFVAGLQSQLGENWSGGVKDVEAAVVKVAPDYAKKGLSAIPASARGLVSGLLDSRRPPSGMEAIDERLRSNIEGYEKLSGELRSGESAVAGVKNMATDRAAEKKGGGEKKAGRLERLESLMIEIESDWAELAAASDGRYVPPSFRVHPRHAVWRAKKYRRVDEKLGSATDAAREEFGGDEGLAAAGRAFVKARRGGEEALRQFAESVGDSGAKALDSILEATDKARGARASGRIKGKKGISTSQREGGGGSEVKIQPDNTTDSNEAKEFLAEYQRIDKLGDGASDDLAATEYVEDGRDEAIGAVLDSEGRKPERSEWSDLLSGQGYDGAGEDVINRAMAIANFSGAIEETNAAAIKYAAAVLPNFEGREEKEFWSYLKNRGVAFEQTDGAVAEEIDLKVEKRGKKRVIIVSESVARPVAPPAEETVKEEAAEEKSKDEEEPPKTKAGIKRKQAIAFILKPEVASARKRLTPFSRDWEISHTDDFFDELGGLAWARYGGSTAAVGGLPKMDMDNDYFDGKRQGGLTIKLSGSRSNPKVSVGVRDATLGEFKAGEKGVDSYSDFVKSAVFRFRLPSLEGKVKVGLDGKIKVGNDVYSFVGEDGKEFFALDSRSLRMVYDLVGDEGWGYISKIGFYEQGKIERAREEYHRVFIFSGNNALGDMVQSDDNMNKSGAIKLPVEINWGDFRPVEDWKKMISGEPIESIEENEENEEKTEGGDDNVESDGRNMWSEREQEEIDNADKGARLSAAVEADKANEKTRRAMFLFSADNKGDLKKMSLGGIYFVAGRAVATDEQAMALVSGIPTLDGAPDDGFMFRKNGEVDFDVAFYNQEEIERVIPKKATARFVQDTRYLIGIKKEDRRENKDSKPKMEWERRG